MRCGLDRDGGLENTRWHLQLWHLASGVFSKHLFSPEEELLPSPLVKNRFRLALLQLRPTRGPRTSRLILEGPQGESTYVQHRQGESSPLIFSPGSTNTRLRRVIVPSHQGHDEPEDIGRLGDGPLQCAF